MGTLNIEFLTTTKMAKSIVYILALIGIGLVATTSGSFFRLLGSLDCTRGPSFWCRDKETAKKCSAEKYCQDHEWSKDKDGVAATEAAKPAEPAEASMAHIIRKNDAGDVIFDMTLQMQGLDANMEKTMQEQMKNMDKNMEEQRKNMRKEMEEQRQSWNEKQRLSPFSSMQKIMESQMKAMDSMFDGSPFESMDKIMDMQMKEMSGLMQNFFGGQKNEKENKKEKEIVQTNEKEDGGDLCGTCVNITTEIRDQFLTKENED